MTDRIRIARIGVFAYHGLHPEEGRLGQRFYISLDCALDLRGAGADDDFHKTVDYGVLTERVQEIAVGQQFRTIEGLAHAIAMACLSEFKALEHVTVTVEKPAAPVAAVLDGVSVEVTRGRADLSR